VIRTIGIIASSTQQGLSTNSYFSIATVTTTAGGTASFTNIPQTYKNLQIRMISRGNKSANNDGGVLRFNSQSSNYNYGGGRNLYGSADSGNASSTSPWIGTSTFGATYGQNSANNLASNIATAAIIDIFNYTSTSVTKNIRSFFGYDTNGAAGQYVGMAQGMWNNTAAITQIDVLPCDLGTFAANSVIALYGIKG
jgi:hypothetical protein